MKRRPLGQILVQRGLMSPPQLKQAIDGQQVSGNRLATEAFMAGVADERALLAVLSSQVGYPGVQLGTLVLPLAVLDVVPERVAREQQLLPIRITSGRLFLAMADPANETATSEIAFTSGCRVLPCVALAGLLDDTINRAYDAKGNGELELRGQLAPESAAADSALALVFPEELSRVPEELISALDRPGEPGPDGEIVVEAVDPDAEDVAGLGDELELRLEADTLLVESEGGDGEQDAQREATQVLVVDDDPDIRRLVVRMLRRRHFEVREASRGLEALAAIRGQPPDLIVLDAMLPEVHGFDICRKLKSSDRYGAIPVIMVSSIYRGWRFARDLRETYGVSAFLEKPFDLNVLTDTVDRVLSTTRRRGSGGRRGISAAAKKCVVQGIRRYKAGDIDGAIQYHKDGLQLEPLSARLHYHLAVLYLKKKGMTYQAMQELEEAATLDPDMFPALKNLAILYQSKGFRNKAIDLWERALRSSSDETTRAHIRRHLMKLL